MTDSGYLIEGGLDEFIVIRQKLGKNYPHVKDIQVPAQIFAAHAHLDKYFCSLQNSQLCVFETCQPFGLITSVKTQAVVKKFLTYDDTHIILGEQEGFIEVLDTEQLKVVLIAQLKDQVDIFDMCKTSNENEFAVA